MQAEKDWCVQTGEILKQRYRLSSRQLPGYSKALQFFTIDQDQKYRFLYTIIIIPTIPRNKIFKLSGSGMLMLNTW